MESFDLESEKKSLEVCDVNEGFKECDVESEKRKMSLEKSSREEGLQLTSDLKPEKEDVSLEKISDKKEANPDEKEYLSEDDYLDDDEDVDDDGELTAYDMDEYREYCKKLVSSGGFDIDRCPPIFQCVHIPLDLVNLMKDGGKKYHKLCRFSTIAIKKYNHDNGKDYQFAKFEKAVSAPCAGTKYYITFEAKEPSSDDEAPTTTFQALVYEGIADRSGPEVIEKIKVMLVRMKSHATKKDNDILLG